MRIKLNRGVVLSHEVTYQVYKKSAYNENYNLEMSIPDFMISRGEFTQVDLTVDGECPAQNGWKLTYKSSPRVPTIYDPLQALKKKLNKKMIEILTNYGYEAPYFKKGTKLEVTATFFMDKALKKKDLDNMAKFLLDAMKNAVYEDDVEVYNLILKKRPAEFPCTTISVKNITIEEE